MVFSILASSVILLPLNQFTKLKIISQSFFSSDSVATELTSLELSSSLEALEVNGIPSNKNKKYNKIAFSTRLIIKTLKALKLLLLILMIEPTTFDSSLLCIMLTTPGFLITTQRATTINKNTAINAVSPTFPIIHT